MSSFGRYTLVRKVGTGGMAEIWKAKAQGPAGFEKILAIKKVLPHLAEDGEFIDMFIAEAKLVAGLVHPNIVQVFDFGQVGKRDYFIAMEYVPGANLAMVLRRISERGSRLPLEVALYVVGETCKGLGYAHAKTDLVGNPLNIVHRDVSPQNVLVSFSGEVKVTDFGIAKVESAMSRTAEGHVRGKLAYMSPEQAATAPLDMRSDLFSLGVILYELVTGKRLFYGSSGSEIFARVTNFKVPTEAELHGVNYEVRQIIQTALQPKQDERYQEASEMEQAVNSALGPEGIVQARNALASIVQRLFDEERKLEMTAEINALAAAAAAGPIPYDDPDDARTEARASGEHSGAMASVLPAHAPEVRPTTPSGLTLAPPVRTGSFSTPHVLPAGPPVIQQSMPAPRDQRLNVLIAVGVLIMMGLAALLGGKFLGVEKPIVATPTPTPYYTVATRTPPTQTPISTPPIVIIPTSTPRVNPTRVVVAATLRPAPTSAPAAGFAQLTVNARPWVKVLVDGREVTAETPLRRHKVTAGKHNLRFVNAGLNFSVARDVEFEADSEKSIFVDVKAGTVKLEGR